MALQGARHQFPALAKGPLAQANPGEYGRGSMNQPRDGTEGQQLQGKFPLRSRAVRAKAATTPGGKTHPGAGQGTETGGAMEQMGNVTGKVEQTQFEQEPGRRATPGGGEEVEQRLEERINLILSLPFGEERLDQFAGVTRQRDGRQVGAQSDAKVDQFRFFQGNQPTGTRGRPMKNHAGERLQRSRETPPTAAGTPRETAQAAMTGGEKGDDTVSLAIVEMAQHNRLGTKQAHRLDG